MRKEWERFQGPAIKSRFEYSPKLSGFKKVSQRFVTKKLKPTEPKAAEVLKEEWPEEEWTDTGTVD